MRNIMVTLEYDGTGFRGWQTQKPGERTVQTTLEEAVSRVVGHPVRINGSGRTDAGVHALAQAANFHTQSEIPAGRLVHAINYHLPLDAAVTSAREVPPDFHARYSARGKTYRYTILSRDARSPLLLRYAWHVRSAPDIGRMREAAAHLLGEHDFQAFRSKPLVGSSSVRTITRLDIQPRDQLIEIHVSANGFLYNMARAIVGTLVQAGLGRLQPGDLPGIVESRDRSLAGPTAPARGLCLVEVVY